MVYYVASQAIQVLLVPDLIELVLAAVATNFGVAVAVVVENYIDAGVDADVDSAYDDDGCYGSDAVATMIIVRMAVAVAVATNVAVAAAVADEWNTLIPLVIMAIPMVVVAVADG